jgi:hypothetical protein
MERIKSLVFQQPFPFILLLPYSTVVGAACLETSQCRYCSSLLLARIQSIIVTSLPAAPMHS